MRLPLAPALWARGPTPHGAFGAPRASGHSHNGTDIAAPVGTPVYAAHAGVVRFAGTDRLGDDGRAPFGGLEWRSLPRALVGPAGTFADLVGVEDVRVRTRYLHLDTLRVRTGDLVAAGDLIGTVGRSGLVEADAPAHLHLEVSRAGELVDPLVALAAPTDAPAPPAPATAAPVAPTPAPAPESSVLPVVILVVLGLAAAAWRGVL